jgi:hypothetical protein
MWDSGILSQYATFSNTFNSTGNFPYYCVVHGECCNMVGTVIVANASPTPTAEAQLGNISTRSLVQTGENVMIGGFIVQGTGSKRVIIRAIGEI